MSNHLNAKEKERVEKFRKSIEEIYARKEVAMFLGVYPTTDTDALRDALRSLDGKPSPLELVIKKLEEEYPYL